MTRRQTVVLMLVVVVMFCDMFSVSRRPTETSARSLLAITAAGRS